MNEPVQIRFPWELSQAEVNAITDFLREKFPALRPLVVVDKPGVPPPDGWRVSSGVSAPRVPRPGRETRAERPN